jgi:hypothetical protein
MGPRTSLECVRKRMTFNSAANRTPIPLFSARNVVGIPAGLSWISRVYCVLKFKLIYTEIFQ